MSRKALNGGGQSGPAIKPLATMQARDAAKLESFRSALNRARFNKSIGKLADKMFATKSRPVNEAYSEKTFRLTNAWKSEFREALARAESYLPSTKAVTQEDKRALADFIKKLKELHRGRPRGGSPRRPAMAERTAAHLVLERLKYMREKTGAKRISKKSGIPAKLIADARKEVSLHFSVPAAKISADNIARLVDKK
ncbi:thiamine kinase-like enzyme [Bradyrhizobium ottawaense]|uniref:hypothetical protein n=1 Tax=Bradyrhizobium ottawaense TaxID=931866 RepID=UPI0038385BB9